MDKTVTSLSLGDSGSRVAGLHDAMWALGDHQALEIPDTETADLRFAVVNDAGRELASSTVIVTATSVSRGTSTSTFAAGLSPNRER
jgi:hypothetical protein